MENNLNTMQNFVSENNEIKKYPTALKNIILIYAIFDIVFSVVIFSDRSGWALFSLMIPIEIISLMLGLIGLIILLRKNKEMPSFQRISSLLIFISMFFSGPFLMSSWLIKLFIN